MRLRLVLMGIVAGCGAADWQPPCADLAWTQVTTPARTGALVGAVGDAIVVQSALSEPGGYVSSDRGATWALAMTGPQDAGPIGLFVGVIADPRTPGAMWVRSDASTQQFTYQLRSGADFAPSDLGWPIAPDYVSGGELHGACANVSPCWLERRAPDGTATDLLDGQVIALATFALDPQRIVTAIAGASADRGTLRTSSDGGATWIDSPAFAPDEVTAIVPGAGAGEVWATTFTQIAHSDDLGATWTFSDHPVARVVAASAGAAFALDQTGAIASTTDGGATWTPIAWPYPVDGIATLDGALVVDDATGLARRDATATTRLDAPFTFTYVADFARAGSALLVAGTPSWRSTDRGATWSPVPESGLLVAPSDPSIVYGQGIRSDDAGATWQPAPTDMSVLAVGGDPDTLYGETSYLPPGDDVPVISVVRSDDRGATYQTLDVPGAVDRMRGDALDADRVYALTQDDHLLRSDDRGATWQTLPAGSLPTPDPVVRDRAWLLVDDVLVVSDDAGATWQPVVGGPAHMLRYTIAGDGTAVVFTEAGEVWAARASGEWHQLGTAPVAVGRAIAGATACDLAILPDLAVTQADRLYVTP